MKASYSSMEEAFEMLSPYGPDLRTGMTSNAPTAVGALSAMARPEAAVPWLETYRAGLLPRPATDSRITMQNWREALGRFDRTADWGAFFEAELSADSWRAVLDRWVNDLAPGISAGAAHGVIRVG